MYTLAVVREEGGGGGVLEREEESLRECSAGKKNELFYR